MASIKIKFRASTVPGGLGTVFYQVIHNRVARQIGTAYRIYESEWDGSRSEIVPPCSDEVRAACLFEIREEIGRDRLRLQRLVASLERSGRPYAADDVVAAFATHDARGSFFGFMEAVIADLRALGRIRTSETYASALKSFRRFRGGDDLSPDQLSPDMMLAYEAYLKGNGVSPNSSSFYMRNLRAVYNRAVEQGITPQRYPFKRVYTGVEKTVKRAVPIKVIRQLRDLDLSLDPASDFARDMFLFSFYTRGMSLVDMAYLRKKDLVRSILSYRRRKTGQQLFIKWERPMQEIVDKYDTGDTAYLLPIIRDPGADERTQYIYAGHNINRRLKIIGRTLGLSVTLTMYVARHAWASIARSKNVPLSVISEGMGHDSEATTRIYLASLDSVAIDRANSMILKSL